ncbi:MAG: hypothetical protein K0M45_09520 [Candidatus Paracaedibacteraceae bacterium]|nr:hypothetical protein [Candidatus Paracaedibacteraceae bacterium]
MVKFQAFVLLFRVCVGIAHSNNPVDSSDENRTFVSEFPTPHIGFKLHDQEIEIIDSVSPIDRQSSEEMVKHLKATKQFMPPQNYNNIQRTQSVLTGRYMDVQFNSGFYIETRDVVNVSLSLWEVRGNATFITPRFKVKDFSLAITGTIKIQAPEHLKTWLKGVIINAPTGLDHPIQCILSGEINFESSSPIDNFLVIGTSEVEFII